MELKLYDTLTREKRKFEPIDPARVRMYVCGPTVYDYAHIGNARPVIVFDVLFRLLRHLYGAEHVTYVRNITDVDDKINARAAEEYPNLPLNEAIREVTNKTDKQFHDDVAALGCLAPTVEPRATENIPQMIDIIGRLLDNGYAYIAYGPQGREVLFSVEKMKSYGQLSNRKLDEQIDGARVAVEPHKKNPLDFVLWKESSASEPGWLGKFKRVRIYPSNTETESIEIYGRPGWHIECSAMSWRFLGETFDIHGGGIDLVFPHHENEIAQSRCAFSTPVMANYWMHNGFLQVEGEKMSKSQGNFVTIHELLEMRPGDVLRLLMMMTHYRQPLDWTKKGARLASLELEGWADAMGGHYRRSEDIPPAEIVSDLCDDLNTPNVLTTIRELFSKAKNGGMQEKLKFGAACKFLGFRNLDRPGVFQFGVSGLNAGSEALGTHSDAVERFRAAIANNNSDVVKSEILGSIRDDGFDVKIDGDSYLTLVRANESSIESKIKSLVNERTAARARKDWKESDRIRDELAAMGVVLKDSKDGTTWEIAR